ncbi:MAG: hypothetical protein OHK0015_39660 [Chloroflexi bacterium OHK40]
MHLLIVSPARLVRQYGARGTERILARVAALESARRAAGLITARLIPEAGMDDPGVPPADPASPEELRAQIVRLADGLARRGTPLTSVLLVGGPTALPFFPCPNPMPDDDDRIPSDYPYGVRHLDGLLLDWAVGRLPDGSGDDPGGLLRLLALATSLHRRPPAPPRAFGYSTAAWQGAAAAIYARLDDPGRLLLAPPISADTLDRRRLHGASRIFCNVHGVAARPTWYGQAAGRRGELVVALRPRDLDGLALTGAVVVCPACYGAFSPSYDLADTIAMRMLLQGAACFIGATTLSYGPAGLPLLGADLLAYHVFGAAADPGARAGDLLRIGRERTLADTLRQQGFLDDDDVKTLVQFVSYGDPALRVA